MEENQGCFPLCRNLRWTYHQAQFPMAFDLTDDPGEQINLTSERMDMMWMYGPVMQRPMALQQSFAEYPNIKPGQAFQGTGSGTDCCLPAASVSLTHSRLNRFGGPLVRQRIEPHPAGLYLS